MANLAGLKSRSEKQAPGMNSRSEKQRRPSPKTTALSPLSPCGRGAGGEGDLSAQADVVFQCGVSTPKNLRRSGFTLIEVLVTIVLVSVALVAVMQGIRALGVTDVKARQADFLQGLAVQKLDELQATENPQTLDDKGDFSEQGYPDITWTLNNQPSGTENINELEITVTQGNAAQSLTELLFVPSVTTGTTGNTGGTAR